MRACVCFSFSASEEKKKTSNLEWKFDPRNAHATVEIIVEILCDTVGERGLSRKFPSLVGPDSERVRVCMLVRGKLKKNELKSLDRDYFVK